MVFNLLQISAKIIFRGLFRKLFSSLGPSYLLFSAPVARIFTHEQPEGHIERNRGIETAMRPQFRHLGLRMRSEIFHRIHDPVIVDILAEVPAAIHTYRLRNIDFVREHDRHYVIDSKIAVQIWFFLFEQVLDPVVKFFEHVFVLRYTIDIFDRREPHRFYYASFMPLLKCKHGV